MKFAQHLSAHITPEWRKQYINYDHMKGMLRMNKDKAPDDLEDPVGFELFRGRFDDEFLQFCHKELLKINTFFQEKLAEAVRLFYTLQSELQNAKEQLAASSSSKNRLLRTTDSARLRALANRGRNTGISELKTAYSEFYLSLVILQNYQELNFTGFRKILKKHDKVFKTDTGAKWRIEHVESAQFYTDKSIDKLLSDTEQTCTDELEGGDRQRAMKRLRVPPLGQLKPQWTVFKVGLFFGAFIVLFIVVILSGLAYRNSVTWNIFMRLYRGPFWIVLFMFLLAINVSGWRRSGVNHVLIFELDPRNSLTEQNLFELAGLFGVLWCLSVLCFFYAEILTVPPYVMPLVLIVIMLAFFLNPSRTFLHGARFWLIKILGRIVLSPFFFVNYIDFWLADQLNSLGRALADLQYLFCFYSTLSGHGNGNWYHQEDNQLCLEDMWWLRLVILCLPAWFRLLQCFRRYRDSNEMFPHLANALKYATAFGVVISSTLNGLYSVPEANDGGLNTSLPIKLNKTALFSPAEEMTETSSASPFFIAWIVFLFISSLYGFVWDVKMDWGLFDSKHKLLREEMVYGAPWIYYSAIVVDFVLRFVWAVSISLSEMSFIQREVITTIFGTLEVVRRFIWNFFRLENEHLNNCGKFRAVRDISVKPMQVLDQDELIYMMDTEDGVRNEKRKKGKAKKTKESPHGHVKISVERESLEEDDEIA